jgi:hypothetical protein
MPSRSGDDPVMRTGTFSGSTTCISLAWFDNELKSEASETDTCTSINSDLSVFYYASGGCYPGWSARLPPTGVFFKRNETGRRRRATHQAHKGVSRGAAPSG